MGAEDGRHVLSLDVVGVYWLGRVRFARFRVIAHAAVGADDGNSALLPLDR